MENRNKFFTKGAWCSDTLKKRYNHIKNVLDAFLQNGIDEDDLKYIIKNAFVSKIYISKEAKEKLDKYKTHCEKAGKDWKLKKLYDEICTDGYLELPGETDGLSHFDFCKVIDLQEKDSEEKNIKLGLRIEHMVPGKVYIDYVLNMVKNGLDNFTQDVFESVFKSVHICIVTADEARNLDKLGFRDKIDANKKNKFIGKPFARYINYNKKIIESKEQISDDKNNMKPISLWNTNMEENKQSSSSDFD